jgi:hypothetical protein
MACVLGVLALSCEEERASNDGVLDGGLDAGGIDASTGAGDGAIACTSWVEPTATTCGGSHCQQTPAQLRTDTPASAACGSDQEVAAFCSLEAVDVVGGCVVEAAGMAAGTKTCAMAKLGAKLSSSCLDCYVASAQCAATNCLAQCIASSKTAACDACRLRSNCVSQFYACAGFKSPDLPVP